MVQGVPFSLWHLFYNYQFRNNGRGSLRARVGGMASGGSSRIVSLEVLMVYRK